VGTSMWVTARKGPKLESARRRCQRLGLLGAGTIESPADASGARRHAERAGERQWSGAERANESAICVPYKVGGRLDLGRASQTRPPPGAALTIRVSG